MYSVQFIKSGKEYFSKVKTCKSCQQRIYSSQEIFHFGMKPQATKTLIVCS